MTLSTRALLGFVLFATLALYYPAMFGGFNSVDDLKMVTALDNQPTLNLTALFRPSSTFYYRPLLILSYYSDGILMGFAPEYMHLVNILLHATNTLLVFALGSFIFSAAGLVSPVPAFLGALLFGLHPLNTESVCWISGRSDLLGTLFVLLSFLVLLRGLQRNRPWSGLVAAVLFLGAVMAKEVMLFFLPVAIFLILRWPQSPGEQPQRIRYWLLGGFAAPFILGALAYAVRRIMAYGSGDAGVNFVLSTFKYEALDTLRVACKVFGFYVKKLFLPLPLNFAIIQVSDYYTWFGLLSLISLIVLYRRRTLFADLLLAAVFLIVPGIAIALTNVAWTPLAERYLYLPTVFWSLAVAGSGAVFMARSPRPLVWQGALVIILLGAGLATAQRALLWQDRVAFYQDAIAKTPNFPPLHNELALALLKDGREEEAQVQSVVAQRLDPERRIPTIHLNRATMLIREGRVAGARQIIDTVLAGEAQPSLTLLQELARANEALLLHQSSEAEKIKTLRQLAEVYEKVHDLTHDPFIRYRQAQVLMLLDEPKLAAVLFADAGQRAPESSHYKQAAVKLADKLQGKTL